MWTLSIIVGVCLFLVPTKGMVWPGASGSNPVGSNLMDNTKGQSYSGCDSKRYSSCEHGHSYCSDGHHRCKCDPGWEGRTCDTPDPCYNYDCGLGTCHRQTFRRFLFPKSSWAHCTCLGGYYGDHCEIAPTTTTTTVATTASPPKQFICDHTKTINDLSGGVLLSNVNASSCSLGDNSGTDALLLTDCNVDPVQTWKQGPPAMSLCSSLPLYTPIATIDSGAAFNTTTDTAGVFLGCLGDSIRVGLQTCAAGARIEHLTRGGGGYSDADSYYVIQ